MMTVTERDKEILRTLLRVQLASRESLERSFFASKRDAQRRLAELRGAGYINPHRKGLPGEIRGNTSYYWKLSARGLALVAKAFPDEVIPENFLNRVARASLRFWEHRTGITEVYLSLVAPAVDVAATVARAAQFQWGGDGEVAFTYTRLGKTARVVPDATATFAKAGQRVFVEFDRASHTLSHCVQSAKNYAAVITQGIYRASYPDNYPAAVLYISPSRQRARHLRAAFADLPHGLAFVKVLDPHNGVAYLSEFLSPVQSLAPPKQPTLEERAAQLLNTAYEDTNAAIRAAQGQGRIVPVPAWLREAHALLTRLEQQSA